MENNYNLRPSEKNPTVKLMVVDFNDENPRPQKIQLNSKRFSDEFSELSQSSWSTEHGSKDFLIQKVSWEDEFILTTISSRFGNESLILECQPTDLSCKILHAEVLSMIIHFYNQSIIND